MRRHCWTVVFCCLAVLTAAVPTAGQMSAGRISLGVSPGGGTALAIDLHALARDLCADKGRPTLRSSAECSLTVANFPTDDGAVARIGISLDVDFGGGETRSADDHKAVQVKPTALELAGTALLSTPCGLWLYSLHLDPAAAQAVAQLSLHQAVKKPAQGMFAGVIEVAALLHLVPLDEGGDPIESAAVDLPFEFTLQLAGAWGGAAGSPDSDTSSLLLFAGFADGVWLSRPGCEWTIFHGVWCESCVEPAPDILESFNDRLRSPG